MDDGGTEDYVDPQPDTDELVVPVWRSLGSHAECDVAAIASALDLAPETRDDPITQERIREALNFLEVHGYARSLGRDRWETTDKSLNALEEDVAALWTSDWAPWLEGRSEHIAAFAADHGFTFTHEAPAWIHDVPIRWLRARNVGLFNAISGTWGRTRFTEFDYWAVKVSTEPAPIADTSCAVTRIDADFFPRVTIRPSDLDRRRWRTAHPLPTPFGQLQDLTRKVYPKRWRIRDTLLDEEMMKWFAGREGPIQAFGEAQPIAFTLAGSWLVCDTPLLAPKRLGHLLDALDGFSRRIPQALNRGSPWASD